MSKRIKTFRAEMAVAKSRFDALWAKVRTDGEDAEMRKLITRMQRQEIEFKELQIEIAKIVAKRGGLINSILIFSIIALVLSVALMISLKAFALLFVLPLLVIIGVLVAYFIYPT